MKGFLNRLIRAGLIVLSIVLIVSCDLGAGSGDGGYLGDTFDVTGPLRFRDKGDFETPDTDGSLEFACASTTFSETVVVDGGVYTVSFGIPDPTDTEPWADLLPPVTPTALTISDPTAEGCILNNVLYDRVTPAVDDDILVLCSNYDIDIVVWYVFTDKDVTITGSGSYAGPLGTDTIDIDVSLQAGWNRIIMTVTGTTAVYRLGSMPSGVYWTYGVS